MSSDTPQVTSVEFRQACGRFTTGVTIATTLDGDGAPHGLTVSSFASVSLEPPLILICLDHKAFNLVYFRAANFFGINVLADFQQDVSVRFSKRVRERFRGVSWCHGATGVPLIEGCIAQMECSIYQRVPMGDHDIIVGRMIRSQIREGEPLVHVAGAYRRLETL